MKMIILCKQGAVQMQMPRLRKQKMHWILSAAECIDACKSVTINLCNHFYIQYIKVYEVLTIGITGPENRAAYLDLD